MYAIGPSDALIVVDLQNDFLPGGSLAVSGAERVFEPIVRIARLFEHLFATRDWHPPDHRSFEQYGGPWPPHCVRGTHGAQFAARFTAAALAEVVDKGVDAQTDGYSGFAGSDLEGRLRARGIERVFVCGLATDYCVRETALGAIERGFTTVVVRDAVAAVNARPADEAGALQAMLARGVYLAHSSELKVAVG